MRILHVFRTPVGGLFRHVRDLARGQAGRGHAVGILCDSSTGGETATRLLETVAPHCSLGVARIPISRLPGLGDISGTRQTIAHARGLAPDIIHCHGAKGGLYGRLAAWHLGIASVYTLHGGSLHYRWGSPKGAAFLAAEWLLARLGDGLHFVCDFEHRRFADKIGLAGKPFKVVHNGLWAEEIVTIEPSPDAADILFIGEMRHLKGVDVLLDALSLLRPRHKLTACLVGDGPDLDRFRAQAAALKLTEAVHFAGRLPASDAFRRGRLLVMPSRNESFPYVVLEACAAGVPIIASNVGGIPEVLPPDCLVPPGEAGMLAARIAQALADMASRRHAAAAAQDNIRRNFAADAMVNGVLDFYRHLLAA